MGNNSSTPISSLKQMNDLPSLDYAPLYSTSLESLGVQDPLTAVNLKYTSEGVLRTITDEKPVFNNQDEYEIGSVAMVKHIQDRLIHQFNFEEHFLPEDWNVDNKYKNNIFISKGALEKEKLVLLIQGSGPVRPGVWARSVCINNSLHLGSIIPYVHRFQLNDYGIIVFNPNQNSALITKNDGSKQSVPIPDNSSPQEHTVFVWDKFVRQSAAKKIAIVAHSNGGPCTYSLLKNRFNEVTQLVKAIAFTDVLCPYSHEKVANKKFLDEISVNWVASDDPLDTYYEPERKNWSTSTLSAGHPKHEFTSGTALESVCKYLINKLA